MNAPSIPRPEYPRPAFRRECWHNLIGPWSFADDPENSGCHCTHTTGIWQNVRLGPVPPTYLER